jgi:hypothetical protein
MNRTFPRRRAANTSVGRRTTMDEIRCPKCGADDFRANIGDDPFVLWCICDRCKHEWKARTLDAPPIEVHGRENGHYWIRLNDTAENVWEIGEWDGRVWGRIADAEPVDESEVAKVGRRILPYKG